MSKNKHLGKSNGATTPSVPDSVFWLPKLDEAVPLATLQMKAMIMVHLTTGHQAPILNLPMILL
jgi:hypothetical protein